MIKNLGKEIIRVFKIVYRINVTLFKSKDQQFSGSTRTMIKHLASTLTPALSDPAPRTLLFHILQRRIRWKKIGVYSNKAQHRKMNSLKSYG